ncbi:MAG: hypothetical protein QGG56_09175 [Dehalococcoidia bacterium]|jgi:hypothetical protein|nr:hypothetical protein [Dehalococcoidia bacterium]
MAMMICPVKGCHSKGWCWHKKVMAVMMMVAIAAVVVLIVA